MTRPWRWPPSTCATPPCCPGRSNPPVPVALEAVIMKAMAKIPDDRYAVGRGAAGGPAPLRRRPPGRGGRSRRHLHDGRGRGHPGGPGGDRPDHGRPRRRRRSPVTGPRTSSNGRSGRAASIILLVLLLVALGVIAFFLPALGASVATSPCPTWWGDTSSRRHPDAAERQPDGGHHHLPQPARTPKGIVLSTNPAAGASVSKNSTVNLVVSGGPNIPIVTVPLGQGQAARPTAIASSFRAPASPTRSTT